MPVISSFYGIKITINYREHHPAHFHAVYGEFEALFSIANSNIIKGNLPKRAENMVLEWARIHHNELVALWQLATEKKPLYEIEPLK